MESPQSLFHTFSGSQSLLLAGLIFIADLNFAARQSALHVGSWLSDSLLLIPGLHKQQEAPFLSRGEYPACAAMTTGYVFRVENEATVYYLQHVGKPGQLTTVRVRNREKTQLGHVPLRDLSGIVYTIAVGRTLWSIYTVWRSGDPSAIATIALLLVSRAINVVIMRLRQSSMWKGKSEPGVEGDLLILMSQDRWIRLRGFVDDLKAVASGQWLRELTALERLLTDTATVFIYLATIASAAATPASQISLLTMMLGNAFLLGFANALMEMSNAFQMKGRLLQVEKSKVYERRLDMAAEMIQEHGGRNDWAIRLGMVQADKQDDGPVTM